MVGKTIKKLRLLKAWRQKDVAEKLGITPAAFNRIELGATDLNISRLEQIAELFGITVIQLINYGNIDSDQFQEYNMLMEKIRQRDKEIIVLQKKMIELLDEIHATKQSGQTSQMINQIARHHSGQQKDQR